MTTANHDRPVCVVVAKYWPTSSGLRYELVLQVMYYTDSARGRGQGPWFHVGYARTKKDAEAKVAEMSRRLTESEAEIAELLLHRFR